LDGTRFDAWTRRRFGLATGGAVASLLGLMNLDDAEAKKKNKNKNKKKNRKKKKKCKKLGQGCDITTKNKKCCSENQLCAQVQHLGGGDFCCKPPGDSCSRDQDCCGSNICGNSGRCET
jgi:hypothetical protein